MPELECPLLVVKQTSIPGDRMSAFSQQETLATHRTLLNFGALRRCWRERSIALGAIDDSVPCNHLCTSKPSHFAFLEHQAGIPLPFPLLLQPLSTTSEAKFIVPETAELNDAAARMIPLPINAKSRAYSTDEIARSSAHRSAKIFPRLVM